MIGLRVNVVFCSLLACIESPAPTYNVCQQLFHVTSLAVWIVLCAHVHMCTYVDIQCTM